MKEAAKVGVAYMSCYNNTHATTLTHTVISHHTDKLLQLRAISTFSLYCREEREILQRER